MSRQAFIPTPGKEGLPAQRGTRHGVRPLAVGHMHDYRHPALRRTSGYCTAIAAILALSNTTVTRRLWVLLAAVGVHKRVSSHSLRNGATTADAILVPVQVRMILGRRRC
jgi:hypothetical protein